MKRWLEIMISVMLVTGLLQVPVYAAETGETAIAVEVDSESVEHANAEEDAENIAHVKDVKDADSVDDATEVSVTKDTDEAESKQYQLEDGRRDFSDIPDVERDIYTGEKSEGSDSINQSPNEDDEIIDLVDTGITNGKASSGNAETAESIWLNDIAPIETSGYYYYDQSQINDIGHAGYSCAVNLDASYNTSAKFELNKLYKSFRGTVCTGVNTGSGVFTISIYGDGKLIQEVSDVSNENNNYSSFSVDVSDVIELEIKSKNSGSWADGWVYIADGLLTRTQNKEYDISSAIIAYWNNHKYMIFEDELTPPEAQAFCESLGGYVVSVTSSGEQEFLEKIVELGDSTGYMIGGTDVASEGNWKWMNGENWDYSNWYPGEDVGTAEPNNGLGSGEDYSIMDEARGWKWVDFYGGYDGYSSTKAFICEWDNGISALNNHIYKRFDEAKSWTGANEYCESTDGHLVTISSHEENDVIAELAKSGSKHCYWIGTVLNENKDYEWVSQEPMLYTNWADDEPDNYMNDQGYVFMYGKILNSNGVGQWGDISENGVSWNNDSFYGTSNFGYICEWDSSFGNSEDIDFHSGVFTINYNSLSASHNFYYDDLFFYSDNNSYNNALAILTLGMELASFSASEDNYNEEIPKESDGYTVRAKNIKDTYKTLGFTDARYYRYGNPLSDPSDKVACSFAKKTITNGTTTDTLVVIPIRGGGYGAEWASNFRVGATGNSYGFNEAAKEVLKDLKTYLHSIEITGELKLWITGFSRAGATANLLTHYINSEANSGALGVSLRTDNIYTYTFAAPNCYDSIVGDASGRDNNIYNIISANDMVPKIPLAKWGYLKYGQVRVLPTYSIDSVASEFENITGRKLEINNMASLWDGISDSLFIVVQDSVEYYNRYQEKVSGIFRDEFSQPGGKLPSAFKDMLGIMLKTNPVCSLIAVGYAGTSLVQSEAEGLASIENMHYPEHYLSWLEFGQSDYAALYSKMTAEDRRKFNAAIGSTFENSYKHYRIYCPVDVRVYSSDGELLVSIIDNEIVEDQLPCSVNGEEKSFFLLGDTDGYHIELTGNDTGTMSYFVEEYNNDSEVVRSVYYYDIPLEEGMVYQDDVSTEIEDVREDYSVTNGETTVEKTLDTLTGPSEKYSIEVENGGSDKAFAAAGQAVMLYADLDEEHEFVRWESDDKDVVFDDDTSPATFVKMPSKDINVCAVMKEKGSEDPLTDIAGANVRISTVSYNGKEQRADVSVVLNEKTLVENTDYAVSGGTATEAGCYQVTITGMGSYTGTIVETFTILPGKTTRGDMFNLANNVKVTWKEVPGAKYYKIYREGVTDPKETRKDPVIVTERLIGWDKDPGLTNGHAYRYRIVASLTGKGDNSGDSSLSYSKLMYRLKTVVIRSVKNTAPGQVTVKYDKTTSGDSYVLQYGERQDMAGAKTKVVLGAGNTSYVIGGLKKGKTYYISIRVRKKVGGIDYYTTFGVAKKITVTK